MGEEPHRGDEEVAGQGQRDAGLLDEDDREQAGVLPASEEVGGALHGGLMPWNRSARNSLPAAGRSGRCVRPGCGVRPGRAHPLRVCPRTQRRTASGLGANAPAAHSCRMAGASQGWHEREELMSARTKDLHRALVSLQEELEAIDWYQQRVDATEDPELRRILAHNRDEEKEHASMILEWIRRRDVAFARMLKKHTGHAGPIVTEEEEAEASGAADPSAAARARRGSDDDLAGSRERPVRAGDLGSHRRDRAQRRGRGARRTAAPRGGGADRLRCPGRRRRGSAPG